MKVWQRMRFSALSPSQLTPLGLDLWLRAELTVSQDPFSSFLIHLIPPQQLEEKVFKRG